MRFKPQIKDFFAKGANLIVCSNLSEFTLSRFDFTVEKHRKIIEQVDKTKKYFLTVTQGTFETTVIVASELEKVITRILGKDKIIYKHSNLSSITINLPGKSVLTPGVYYSILKILAWDGINVVEVVSTYSEFIILLEEKDVGRAFTLLTENLKPV